MSIEIHDKELDKALESLAMRLNNTAPLMQRISVELLAQTMLNFRAEGRPAWAGLSPAYAATKQGGKILQLSGQLAASITPYHGADVAGVGTNKVYAAVHQFGGKIDQPSRKGEVYFKQGKDGTVGNRFVKKSQSNFAQSVVFKARSVGIPARPYLPFIAGQLQPQARGAIMLVIDRYVSQP